MAIRFFVTLVAITFIWPAIASPSDREKREGVDKVTDGAVLFGRITRPARWCLVIYPPYTFVIEKRHLEGSWEN